MLAEISVAMAMRSPLEALGAGPGWRGGAGSSVAMQSAAEFVVHGDVGGLRRRWWPSKDAATPKSIADRARICETREPCNVGRHDGALPGPHRIWFCSCCPG